MSRLPFEAFLALRYLRPRRTFVSVITVISIIGVLLGVAVLIIVISVMSGFDKEWRVRILGFNAHLKVFPAVHGEVLTNYESMMRKISANPEVIGVSPFIGSKVLFETEPQIGPTNYDVAALFGVDPETIGKVNVLPKSIVAGKFDLEDKGVIVGQDFAAGLGLQIGDRLAIYSARSVEKMRATIGKTNAEYILPQDYSIRGVFDVDFPDFNSSIIVTSLEDARDLQAMPDDSVQGLQIKLRDAFEADRVAEDLSRALGDNVSIMTWRQENPAMFNALAVEKNTMFYILFFIVIVSAFGIVNCQITFVVQKTREIGILKSIGATQGQILWLFLSQSIVVGALGVGLGFGVGMLALAYRNEFLEFMRHTTGMELVPASIYHTYELPVSIQAGDVAAICGAAFFICVLAGLFPAWKASRLQPVEALRYG
jgi:lipoprotein-releasing system permease protein